MVTSKNGMNIGRGYIKTITADWGLRQQGKQKTKHTQQKSS